MTDVDMYKKGVKTPNGHVDRDKQKEDWLKRKIDWITFYRRNIHRFIEHYFNIKLHPYQILWIYFMSKCDYFVTIASRATAKSWLIAVYALAIAVLYPKSEVVVASKTQKQATIILGKIAGLMNEYPMVNREISRYANTSNDAGCTLYNSSTVKVVACQETGRGARATLTIGEEFVKLDKDKYDSVVRQFAYARQTGYGNLPEWQYLPPEEPKEILISSAFHKGLWWYTETSGAIKSMIKGRSAGFIAFDYCVAVHHKIKTLKQIQQNKRELGAITFQEECCNIPWGESSDAYFKLIMFDKSRNIKKAFYPQRRDNYSAKKNPYFIKKVDGEVRILSGDIAARAGIKNDNTILACIRCLPTSDGYIRDICYMESHSGENTYVQATRIKQLFYDFEADYFVLDIQNSGVSIFDDLGLIIKDDERGVEYPAWTTMYTNDMDDKTYDELKNRTISRNADEIIYPVSATARLNNDIAVDFRDKLQKKKISFLIDEVVADEYLITNNQDYMKWSDDISEKAWYLHPYIQTSALVNECVSLGMTMLNGYIKLKEPSGGRKDRYTSVSYGSYFVSIYLDPQIRKDEEFLDEKDLANSVFW